MQKLALVLAIYLLVSACSDDENSITSFAETTTSSVSSPPTPEWKVLVEQQLASLLVNDDPVTGYNRDDWGSWRDDDGDCMNTRHEVLLEESLEPVGLTSDGCKVSEGYWYGAFAGVYTTDPSEFDIDHFVPLGNAHDSGGWEWSEEKKKAYYNDLSDPQHLIAVSASQNRSKGKRGPDE